VTRQPEPNAGTKKAADEKEKQPMRKEERAAHATVKFVPPVITDSISLQETTDVYAEASVKQDSEVKKSEEASPAELSEMVVTGYGVKRAKAADAVNMKGGYTPPEPAGGKENFDKYILENRRIPVTLKADTTDEVELSLTILRTGVIDKIKVIRSPGKVFSDEAIRLVKEGPAWTPAERNGEKMTDVVMVTIEFKSR
jgi:hypothetical protein